MSNKAHTAALNRIAHRYGAQPTPDGAFDIQAPGFVIDVETSASLDEAVEKLRNQVGAVYIAITNKEGIPLALEKTSGTIIGVMDPRGTVVRNSGNHSPPAPSECQE